LFTQKALGQFRFDFGDFTLFRLFVSLGFLVVLALFTALIAPYFIDWTAYKKDFERQASRIIGQKVIVGGNADVRLLPLPSISFSQLAVGENAENEPMMTVERFSANVELLPFLSGEVRIVDMALDSPVFNLEIDDAGKIAWTERQESVVDPDQVKLDSLKITNAAFNLKGIDPDRVIRGEKISANVSALSLYGPWTISGAGIVDGQESQFEIGTGRLSDDQSVRLKTRMIRLDKPYELAADGVVSLKNNILSWGGKFDLRPVNGKDVRLASGTVAALPVAISGDFTLDPTELTLPEYRIDIGSPEDPYSLTGIGRAQLKGGVDFQLQIDGRQIDINRIAKMREGESAVANSMKERIALFGEILEQVPVPPFKGQIDIEIPAIIAGDTFIREVSTVVRPFGSDWEIVRFASSFPGSTRVEAKGRLGSGETFGFHGDLLIASSQPSGFASWAAGEVDPAIRRLSSAGLSANVTMTRDQISLDQMELILDQNKLTGNIKRLNPFETVQTSGDGKEVFLPGIVANLNGDNVRLEDLRGIAALLAGKDSISLNNDFDVMLKAGTLSGFDLTAADVDLQFQYKGGELSISKLNARDFLGANLKSTGQIANILEQSKGNISIDLDAGDLSLIAETLGERVGWNPGLRALVGDAGLSKNTALKIVLDSNADQDAPARSRFIVSGEIGGTTIAMRGGFRGSLNKFEDIWIESSIEADNENGSLLLKQIGLAELGFDPIYGELETPLKLVFETAGSNEEGYSTIISANTDDTAFSAKGLIKDLDGEVPSLDFDVTLGSQNFSPYATSFGYFLPELNSILGDVAPLSTKFRWQTGNDIANTLTFEKGQLYGNAFSGELVREINAAGASSYRGDLVVDAVSMNVLLALATGQSFYSELGALSETEFSSPALIGIDAQLKIKANQADIGFEQLASDLLLDLNIKDGDMSINSMSAIWLEADLSGSAAFTNSEGTAVVNGQWTATNVDSANVLENFDISPSVSGKANIVGTVEASGGSPSALIRSMAGSGLLAMKEGQIEGIGNNDITPIIEAADVEGFEINSTNITPMIRDVFAQGNLEITDLEAPFSISRGSLQFRNISLSGAVSGGRSAPVGSVEIDLISGEQSTEIRLFPDPGKQSVSGGNPDVRLSWSGLVGAPKLAVDSAAMEGYLSIRSFENEQRRVEILQASILEKQRFRYELLKSRSRDQWLFAKQQEEERLAREEAERLAKEEADRLAREEAERLAAEAARLEEQRLAEEREELLRIETERLLEAERLAAEEAERKRLAEEAAAQKEKERLAEEKAVAQREAIEKANAEKERIAAEKLEAEKIATEKLRREAEATQTDSQQKNGFVIKPLPEPDASYAPDIFRNIEELLNAQ